MVYLILLTCGMDFLLIYSQVSSDPLENVNAPVVTPTAEQLQAAYESGQKDAKALIHTHLAQVAKQVITHLSLQI